MFQFIKNGEKVLIELSHGQTLAHCYQFLEAISPTKQLRVIWVSIDEAIDVIIMFLSIKHTIISTLQMSQYLKEEKKNSWNT